MYKNCILFLVRIFVFLLLPFAASAQQSASLKISIPSPLTSYSTEWNKSDYLVCNTAINEPYLNPKEKEIIYILNLLRKSPQLFAQTVVKNYPRLQDKTHLLNDAYYKLLLKELSKLAPLPLLYPDKKCFESAYCHAKTSGQSGYVGHNRKNACKAIENFNAECCDYGNDDPLDIVLSLLIDSDVPSLGHRRILLSNNYKKIGVSIQPHKKYQYNTVLDLLY